MVLFAHDIWGSYNTDNNNIVYDEKPMVDGVEYAYYIRSIDQWIAKTNEVWSKKAHQCKLRNRTDYDSDDILVTDTLTPDEKIQKFENILENELGIDRHIFQREFHRRLVPMMAHLIVGPQQWEFVGQDIIRRRKWEFITQSSILMAMAFRRVGKTVSCQMPGATLLVTTPSIRVAVFSTGLRVSVLFGIGVYKMLLSMGQDHLIIKHTEELMVLKGDHPLQARTLIMCPSDSDIYIFYSRFLFSTRSYGGGDEREKRLIAPLLTFFTGILWDEGESTKNDVLRVDVNKLFIYTILVQSPIFYMEVF